MTDYVSIEDTVCRQKRTHGSLWIQCSGHTYGGVGVRQLVGGVVVGFQRERLPPVESQHFGEGCSMVLWEYLAIATMNNTHNSLVY